MKILVTGANGFVGKNLKVRIEERNDWEIIAVTRNTTAKETEDLLRGADAVIHLAGINRPENTAEFKTGNADYTEQLCKLMAEQARKLPVLFASSIQVGSDNPYANSKRDAEKHLEAYAVQTGSPVAICRLMNVFGKWCRPNYNSAVATFCYNISHDLPIKINDPDADLQLVYVDDVVTAMLDWVVKSGEGLQWPEIGPIWKMTVGELADQLTDYRKSRESLLVDMVGEGVGRALYATYLSYCDRDNFTYPLIKHGDERGIFVEMLKTTGSGQVSYFTAHPGVTRGGHYHHTKNEKFLVVKGNARFRFRNLDTDETTVVETNGEEPTVVETVPGWLHDITNIGEEEMIVMLWANEIFDRDHPDTIAGELT
ncbi:MAG: capsular biosynthesis protein [Hyphomicrobiales bacterium]|nr:MAG: capsular biosynthesis protein [Hyphomicrobiales bacterium]